ncbi:MBOAT family O-acyltransferase [Paenisporosarcina sp. TG-14]|uniref:MBOAT family O-acyltransferase n=1 Tax=Paenisporosarcina sp. TG-14 TaxID=1231057 RepID=UPI00031CE6D9|nr:MBOAT family O-acyltransferase [Paenisporosarcina sp. TG-14]
MLFNSIEFLLLFLPVVFLIYFGLHKIKLHKMALFLLIISSLVFYSFWNPVYLFLIVGSMIFNFLIGTIMNGSKKIFSRNLLLVMGVLGNVSLLGYFKYYDFFVENANFLFETNIALQNLLLPLAISFFTFQQIAFIIDTYRGETKQYSFMTYALFVTFFPQLIAGPIVHHHEMIPQFNDKSKYHIQLSNIVKGIFIFSIGLFKKVGIADTFAVWANEGYANVETLTFVESWLTSLSYTMQLYFDFSGYCDMAIGLALLFNIKLPVNFFSPYKSRNIQEFWKRWHMTLSRFLTHYLYFPLGGNRKGEYRTYINIIIIFAVSGLWHGAGWTFVVWGTLHGFASIIVRVWGKTKIVLPFVVSWFITFSFINLAWVYFRAESLGQAHTLFGKMFTLDQSILHVFNQKLAFASTWETFEFLGVHWLTNPMFVLPFLLLFLAVSLLAPNSIQLLEKFEPKVSTLLLVNFCIIAVLFVTYILHKNSEFLYFNF